MKVFSYILLILSIGGLLFFVACQNSSATKETTEQDEHSEHEEHGEGEAMEVALTDDQSKIAGIETDTVRMRNLTGSIQLNGTLDVPPQNLVSISAPAAGYLKQSELLQGMRVKKGQVIAVLQNPDFVQMQQEYLETRSALDETRSRLEYLELDYKRQEELAKENVNSQKTLQAAKSEYNSAKAQISGLEARLGGQRAKLRLLNINPDRIAPNRFQSQINIYAPISGYVTEVNVNIGKFVNTSEVMFEIVDTEHLHAELTVFEKDITKIKVGQTVRFTLANESQERTAKVYLIGKEINQDRSIQVHCHLSEEDTQLLPGMYLKAILETGATATPSLPEAAIVSSEGKDYIFIVETEAEHNQEGEEHEEAEGEHAEETEHSEQHFSMVEVRKGITQNGFAAVTLPQDFDLKNTKVVTKGAFYLLSAAKAGESEHAH